MSEEKFRELVDEFSITEGATTGHMFGHPCLKINGKIFMTLMDDGSVIFKLRGEEHARALALDGAKLFQPTPDASPMKEWVRVPSTYADHWRDFGLEALMYVREVASKKKKK